MDSVDLFADFTEEADAQAGYDDDDDNQQDQGSDNGETENKEVVEAKLKVFKAKRKIATLNVERLKGPRGIIAIDDFYKDIKFRGKGYEDQDLKNVMKRLEHWAHRMYPKYNFDDSLNAIDRLGKKKEVAVHMTRYRLDQLTKDDDERILSDGDEEENRREDRAADEPMDEFEALIDEQIALTTLHSRTNQSMDKSFGNISSISSANNLNDRISSSSQAQLSQLSQTPQSLLSSTQNKVEISEEVRARIEENKRRALAIRDQRKKEGEEKQKLLDIEENQKAEEISNINIDDDF